jgi:hypothetical protein
MGDRTYSFDVNNQLSDGAASYTANGYAQFGGADGVVDLGGNQGATVTLPSIADVTTITPGQPRIDAVVVVDVTGGLFTGTTLFKLMVVMSNNPAFSAGTVQIAGMLEFGNAAGLDFINGITTPAPSAVGGSRYEILFTNEQNNVKYQFLKLYNVIANSATLTYKAFVAVLPRA